MPGSPSTGAGAALSKTRFYTIPRPEQRSEQTSKTVDEWLDEANQHLGNNNFKGALSIYIGMADTDQTTQEDKQRAIICIELMFKNKNGNSPINDDEVMKKIIDFCEKKAESQASLHTLGFLYQHGFGVKQDYEKAFNYYTLGHTNNFIAATNSLGYLYQHGLGVEPNLEAAFNLYNQVVVDSPQAMNNLGLMYEYGLFVDRDLPVARMFYENASKHGSYEAADNLVRINALINNCIDGEFEDNFEIIPPLVSKKKEPFNAEKKQFASQCVKDNENIKAMDIYLSLADEGDEEAVNSLFQIVLESMVDFTNSAEFDYCIKQADEYNSPTAMFICGLIFENVAEKAQTIVYQNVARAKHRQEQNKSHDFATLVIEYRAKALSYFDRAAEHNSVPAMNSLGSIYADGRCGVEKNPHKAIDWLERAYHLGSSYAAFNLGRIHLYGKFVVQSHSIARDYLKIAYARGRLDAARMLAYSYNEGNSWGFNKDEAQGAYWNEKYRADQAKQRLEQEVEYQANQANQAKQKTGQEVEQDDLHFSSDEIEDEQDNLRVSSDEIPLRDLS